MEEKKIFGTDGVRGQANIFPMTVETALALGRAAGILFRRREGKHRVVIGKDTRLSCYMFENALISGLCSMGVDTLMVGPLPTPAVAFITRAYRADAGIVISASHNRFSDNGIKFFSSDGYKLNEEWEQEMEKLVHSGDFSAALPKADRIGRNYKVVDAHGRYIEFAKASFPKDQSLAGIRIALDCANGSGYKVAPLIFKELDAEVFVIGDQPNGLNINLECGALHTKELRQMVKERNAHVGIALDGDADRVIMVDENGEVVDGDQLLAICADDLKKSGQLKNNCVVSTVMANCGFEKAMEERGIKVIRSRVGDRFVIQDMIDHQSNLGGEQSGHIILSDYNTTGDGIVAALQVLRIMKEKKKKLSELASIVKRYPQVCLNISVSSKPPIDQLSRVQKEIQTVEEELKGDGRVLVRYSGTESVCRVMVEGKEIQSVQKFAEQIGSAVKEEIGA